MIAFIKNMIKFIFLVFLASCGGHLVKDIHPSPAKHGYHRMEFLISNNSLKKEIGIGNIFVLANQKLEGVYFEFRGIHKGTLHMKSAACGIDMNTNFDGNTRFYLDDLTPNPTKCSIKLTATTDPLNKREHNIVETGVVKINVLKEGSLPLGMVYNRTNALRKSTIPYKKTLTGVTYKYYSYIGQGSMQRQAGDLTRNEKISVITLLKDGGKYRINGCGKEVTGEFSKTNFEVSFYDLYKKHLLTREDSCDFEFSVIPNSSPKSHYGRFSLSIYDTEVVKLEPMEFKIKKKFASKKKKITTEGRKYVVACSISDKFKIKNKCSHDYEDGNVYWIRSFTANGRKNVFAVKDGEVIWKE